MNVLENSECLLGDVTTITTTKHIDTRVVGDEIYALVRARFPDNVERVVTIALRPETRPAILEEQCRLRTVADNAVFGYSKRGTFVEIPHLREIGDGPAPKIRQGRLPGEPISVLHWSPERTDLKEKTTRGELLRERLRLCGYVAAMAAGAAMTYASMRQSEIPAHCERPPAASAAPGPTLPKTLHL